MQEANMKVAKMGAIAGVIAAVLGSAINFLISFVEINERDVAYKITVLSEFSAYVSVVSSGNKSSCVFC